MAVWRLPARDLGDGGSTELLFVGRDGEGLSYSNWYHRMWVPAKFTIKRAGLQFYDLRRTNATGLVQEGVEHRRTHLASSLVSSARHGRRDSDRGGDIGTQRTHADDGTLRREIKLR